MGIKKTTVFMITFISLIGADTYSVEAEDICQCRDDDIANGIYRICNYYPLNPGNQWFYTTGERRVVSDTQTCSSGYSGILFETDSYEYSR